MPFDWQNITPSTDEQASAAPTDEGILPPAETTNSWSFDDDQWMMDSGSDEDEEPPLNEDDDDEENADCKFTWHHDPVCEQVAQVDGDPDKMIYLAHEFDAKATSIFLSEYSTFDERCMAAHMLDEAERLIAKAARIREILGY